MTAAVQPAESERYLTEQIITYLGNKRALLSFLGRAVDEVCAALGRDKLDAADLFSGSGIVARFLKRYARTLYVNDLEGYCRTISSCYLTDAAAVDQDALRARHDALCARIVREGFRPGFLAELYAPRDDACIRPGERVFYTTRNARYLDTCRQLLEEEPEPFRTLLLAPLLYEASVHTNTAGVFKGFYKNSVTGIGQFGGNGRNALARIRGDIALPLPVFSRFRCETQVFREDALALAARLPRLDLVYLDPPYNQHPYGSNYFMLNLINDYRRPAAVSGVSGIPRDWNKSAWNRRAAAREQMGALCAALDARFLLISFNSEGFLSREEMLSLLAEIGRVRVMETPYNAFRGSRNLAGRELRVKEYLYLVDKGSRA